MFNNLKKIFKGKKYPIDKDGFIDIERWIRLKELKKEKEELEK